MKQKPFALAVGLLLVAIFGMWLCAFQVRQSEVAVVTTFGRPTRPITNANWYVQAPWPIQRVWKFDQRVQNFDYKLTETLTRDNFNLVPAIYAGWKITDPTAFFPKFAGTEKPIADAEQVLQRLMGNAVTAIVGKHPLSDFVSATDNGTNFVAVENEILAAVQSQVRANNYGLDVIFLGFKKIDLPEKVTESVFERMTSERKVLADKSQFEGEAEAQKIRSEAERKAAEMLANADSQATRIQGEGEAQAAKSLAVFQQNPELANFIFDLNAIEGSLKERSTLIFDQHTHPFDLFQGVSTNLLKK